MNASSGTAGRRLVVEADGGSRGNPGVAGYGAVVRDGRTRALLVELAEPLGIASNNVAEYSGLIAGLRAAADIDPGASVQVRLDSSLVVKQMTGEYKIKHPDMRRLALEAREVCTGIEEAGGSVAFEWVPREKNKAADALSNDAMDGKVVRRFHDGPDPAAAAVGSTVGSTDGSTALPATAGRGPDGTASRPLRLLMVQVPDHAGVADRVVRAVRRLVGPSAQVLTAPGKVETQLGSRLAAELGAEPEQAAAWSGAAPGEGADETVLTAYGALLATGGTVVVVTSRRAILSVLAEVLGTPVDRFWAVATAPGSLTAVEVWEDGSASVAFTNRTEHLA